MIFKKTIIKKFMTFILSCILLITSSFSTVYAMETSMPNRVQVKAYDLNDTSTIKESRALPLIARLVLIGGKYVIKYGSKIYKAVSSSIVINALRNYKSITFTAGKFKFLLSKQDIKQLYPEYYGSMSIS